MQPLKDFLLKHPYFKKIEKKYNKVPVTLDMLINQKGEIDWKYFESILDEYHNSQPDSMFAKGRYTLATRPENHYVEEKNTLNHIKFVT